MNLYDKRVVGLFSTSRRRGESDEQVVQRRLGINTPVEYNSEQTTRQANKDSSEGRCRRDDKFKRKTHLDLIENYFNKNSFVQLSTMKKYLSILKDFQSIFPLLSPDNVVDYLKINFEPNSNDNSSIHFKRSTYLKCKSLLKRFMEMSYILPGSYFAGLDRSINSPKSNQDR